jgi:hypothetical protein
MSSSIMRTAVLQATAIFTISAILGHHLSENMFNQVWEDEGFLNMTSVLNKTTPYGSSNHSSSRLISDAGNSTNTTLSLSRTTDISNATAVNGTSAMPKMSVESIYGWRLPREVAIYLVISTLQYYWLIWLERILPARPRRRDVPYQRHEKVEESEDREEEIVQRWIAQGRVKRASLNWYNTFLKWVLELTVGRLWYHAIEHVLRVLLRDGAPRSMFKGMKGVSQHQAAPICFISNEHSISGSISSAFIFLLTH